MVVCVCGGWWCERVARARKESNDEAVAREDLQRIQRISRRARKKTDETPRRRLLLVRQARDHRASLGCKLATSMVHVYILEYTSSRYVRALCLQSTAAPAAPRFSADLKKIAFSLPF